MVHHKCYTVFSLKNLQKRQLNTYHSYLPLTEYKQQWLRNKFVCKENLKTWPVCTLTNGSLIKCMVIHGCIILASEKKTVHLTQPGLVCQLERCYTHHSENYTLYFKSCTKNSSCQFTSSTIARNNLNCALRTLGSEQLIQIFFFFFFGHKFLPRK